MERGKTKYYAVKKGRVPGIYTTWKEAERQVMGFKKAQHQSFSLLEEAEEYMKDDDDGDSTGGGARFGSQLGGTGNLGTPSSIRKPGVGGRHLEVGESSGTKKMSTVGFGREDPFAGGGSPGGTFRRVQGQIYSAGGHAPGGFLSHAPGGSSSVGEGVNGNAVFLYVEDMELLLHRACGALFVGSPVFDPSLTQAEDGSVIFEFAVYLPRNERGLELVAHGPPSFDERTARQEASFALLEKVVAVTGLGICDYTYRTLGRRQQINVEVTEGSAGRLLQRVLELEDKNKELEDQLKALQSIFE